MKLYFFLILLLISILSCSQDDDNLFQVLEHKQTGLHFSNDLTCTTDFNILSYLYFYNGGGVGIGDVNNDGLQDIYLCGNQVNDKLFLNKGDFKFTDLSSMLPQSDLKGWSNGVTFVDINHDGFLDIYVSKLSGVLNLNDSNKLFINNRGISFTEEAKKYNLDFSGLATQASFFDYDRDGDLDCYLLNHAIKDPAQFRLSDIRLTVDSTSGDRLLENVNGKFTDVSKDANIYSSNIGFGLGIDIVDVNNDGWLDVYICNDFHEQDYLYVNQGNKTFKESIAESTGHTSNFSMGCSLSDLNNDLKTDIVTMDMKPPTYLDYKKSGGWESIQIYNYKRSFGYHDQSPKNCVQFNLGNIQNIPQFSEQASYYNLSATDWSWSPLIYDFDNDGDKDVFITNGIQYRPNDLDFIKFHFSNSNKNDLDKLELMPSGLAKNMFFENDLFENKFNRSFVGKLNATTGAAVADLNLDGNLDIVLNEVNGSVKILKNLNSNDFVSVELKGSGRNIFGLGAKIFLYQDRVTQVVDIKSSSGFQSCGPAKAHFGVSKSKIDSLVVIWPDGTRQVELGIIRNKHIVIDQKKTSNSLEFVSSSSKVEAIPNFKVSMPLSQNQISDKWLLYDPECTYDLIFPIDDKSCFVLNNDRHSLNILKFKEKTISKIEITGLNNEIKILYAGSSKENEYYLLAQNFENNNYVTSIFYLDDRFKIIKSDILNINMDLSFAKVLINDFDFDNDLDIVIGGNYKSGNYGCFSKTKFYINNDGKFLSKDLFENEMVYDMEFVNLDLDSELELIVVGHWFPITIVDDISSNVTKTTIENTSGLWFSIETGDFDNDGNIDLFAGNFGTNHDLTINSKSPLNLYSNDFDQNGVVEALITIFDNGSELPYYGHETFTDQLPIVKKDYIKSIDFAKASIQEIIGENKLENSIKKNLSTMKSMHFELIDENWMEREISFELNKFPITNIISNKQQLLVMGNLDVVDPNLGKQDAGVITNLTFQGNNMTLAKNNKEAAIERRVIWDAIFNDSTLYYIVQNDSLRFSNFN